MDIPLEISLDTEARLRRFATLLERWNSRLNLVAPRDIPVLWDRHVLDSLQLAPLLPAGTDRAIDLGSGGGFPGLMLAIATGIPFDLIEADQRKAAFLRSAVLETGARARVHACRIEDAQVAPAPVITARALAPLPRLLPLAEPLLAPAGVCLLLKGARIADELRDADAGGWNMSVEQIPSLTGGGVVLRLGGIKRRAC